MAVRPADKGDLLDIVLLTKQFLREFKAPITLDKEHFVSNLEAMVESPDVFLHVAVIEGEVIGYLAGLKNQTVFSKDIFAVEIGWYMDPVYRKGKDSIKLLNSFEQWAKDQGCTVVSMGDLAKLQDLGSLYERREYELYERTYIKRIN